MLQVVWTHVILNKWLFKVQKNIKLMVLHKVMWWCPQVDNEFKDYEKNSDFNIVKVMKYTSKKKLDHLLLSIILYDKYWRSQLDILHLSIQHNNRGHTKKIKLILNNVLLLLLGLWPKNNGFSISEHFFGPLYHACALIELPFLMK